MKTKAGLDYEAAADIDTTRDREVMVTATDSKGGTD